jgi:hypothetical protein
MTQWWEISGALCVEESQTTRVFRRRPLVGVGIDIAGWPDERACYAHWGHTHTDANGHFRLRVNRPTWAHRLRITASFVGELLVVCDETTRGVAGRKPVTIFEGEDPVEGPYVDVGTIVIREGADGELGDASTVRRAISWYASRASMDYLSSLGEGLSFRRRIAVVCPLATPFESPRVITALGMMTLGDGRDAWSIDMIVRQVMRHWARQCIAGPITWPPDRLSIPVDDQFVELAKDELMRQLWGRQSSPARRQATDDREVVGRSRGWPRRSVSN